MKSLDKKKEYINKKDIIKYKIPVDKNFLKMFKDDDIFEITKPESLDKKKTKELEWTEEYRKLLKEYQVNAEDWDCFPDLGVKFINDLLIQQRTELTCINQPRRYGKSTFVTDKFLAGCKNNEAVEYHQVGWIALSAKAYKNRLEKVRTELLEEILNL